MADRLLHQVSMEAPVLRAATGMSRTRDLAEVEDAARQFESVFLSKMLEGMSTGLSGSVLSGGQAEATWRSFMNDEYAKLISRSGGIGVADAVQKAMLGTQEIG
jgi:Rod binding domain-containing protein